MSIQNNANPAAAGVVLAVEQAISTLPPDIQSVLALHPVAAGVYQTQDGDWVVPVASGASDAMQKSHQLHRILSDVQREAEHKLRAFVTVVLAA